MPGQSMGGDSLGGFAESAQPRALTCVGYLGHPFTKLPVSLSLVPSTDVFRLCNFPKVLFLKLARIPVLFLILGRKFLTGEGRFSAPSRSFYSKVMADGTDVVMSIISMEFTLILLLAWKKYANAFAKRLRPTWN